MNFNRRPFMILILFGSSRICHEELISLRFVLYNKLGAFSFTRHWMEVTIPTDLKAAGEKTRTMPPQQMEDSLE